MKLARVFFSLLGFNLALCTCAVRGDVTLAPLFSDHAVLQRDKPIPIWGRAAAGEKITVTFLDQRVSATPRTDGQWTVLLAPIAARAEGNDLVVAGKNTVTVHDVVVGEVWLCSGQSNMEWPLASAANAGEEIAAANFPLIRHVKIERTVATAPAEAVRTGGWQPASPQTAGAFTAAGYFFARDIFQKLGVPIGLVHSSWGGTPVESWMSPAALASDPAFGVVAERWKQNLAAFPAKKARFEAELAAWEKEEAETKAAGADQHSAFLKQKPRPRGPGDPAIPGGLFNGMINPLLPYALRGALWYQGESNAARAEEYHALFAAMITSWRAHFGQGDFPFFWVQLAAYRVPGDNRGTSLAFLREAQTQTLTLPNTGQAIAIDLGEPNNIHPKNKQDVGRRLALLAKNRIYGITADDTGPAFLSATREGSALRVRFTHVGSGLVAHDKPLESLEIAGVDKVFRPATAKIERDTLLVRSPEVRDPVAVRYAWRNSPEANLYSGAGLPAVPFRSDAW